MIILLKHNHKSRNWYDLERVRDEQCKIKSRQKQQQQQTQHIYVIDYYLNYK